MAVFLIDFDGTCVPRLPEIGFTEIDTGAERVLKRIVNSGHSLVLWTARNSSRNNPLNYISGKFRIETSLNEAERWFREREIPLVGINEVPGEEDIIGYSRKALGDFLIDDTAVGTPLVWGKVRYYSLITKETKEVYTCCVDWTIIERILEEQGLISSV